MEIKVFNFLGQGRKPWQAVVRVIETEDKGPFDRGFSQRGPSFVCSCVDFNEVVISATSRELREKLVNQVAGAVLYEDSPAAFTDRRVTRPPLPLKIEKLSEFEAAPAIVGEVPEWVYRKRREK